MRVLILANNDVGLYKFRKELLEELIKENHEVYVSLPNGDFISSIEEIGCKFIETEFSRHGINPLDELKILKKYKKLLRELRPDVVFTYTIKPNVYGGMACGSLGIPYIANITGLGNAVENPGVMQKITLFLYKLGLKKAQKVFFQNTENRDFMLKHNVINGAHDLLPGSGVNLNNYVVHEYPSDDVINFVFVARIMKEKGIDQYFDAAKFIRNKYPNTRFHICGACEDDYSEKLKELENNGIIIYHGLVKDMSEIYKMVHCTIHPTYYPEGLSNVLLESCASGRPIITTDRSGCREVVDDGINGYVISQKSSESLIENIEKFLLLSNEEKKQLGIAGRRKVERQFDRQIVVNKYISELKNEKKN
ncbi:MAG: glycosyltransferase family 4 protein [Oscillospiraceae bacterium]|nr:glycosyltransferase family 4 protein [Oscillospiraceae bacterium]